MSNRKSRGKDLFATAFAETPIQTYRERVLALLGDVYTSIRPLAWMDSQRRLNFLASSLLFSAGRFRVLITAAHVLDEERIRGQLYVATPMGPLPLHGTRRWTAAPDGDRDNDPFDLGFVLLDRDTADALRPCRFLTTNDLELSSEPAQLPEDCVAIGFPGNWVSGSDPEKAVARPMIAIGPRLDAKRFTGFGVADSSHALMGFDKHASVDLDGPRVPPDPNGMSGGGLWRFSSLKGDAESPNKLVGMLIEWRAPAMIATRVGLLVGALADLVPGMRSALGQIDLAPVNHRME